MIFFMKFFGTSRWSWGEGPGGRAEQVESAKSGVSRVLESRGVWILEF